MDDLERVELAARRIAAREKLKAESGGVTNLDHVRVFEELAAELATMARERAVGL